MPTVARVLHQGLAADKPTADAALNQGWVYYETDTGQLMQSWGGAWVMIGAAAGGAASAMVKVDEHIVGSGGAANIIFSGVPNTYRHLQLTVVGRSDVAAAAADVRMQVNADTGANYDWQYGWFFHATVGGGNTDGDTSFEIGYMTGATGPTNQAGVIIATVYAYAGTTFFKSYESRCQFRDAASNRNFALQTAGDWRSTAAIAAITLFPGAGNFVNGSVATLYGLT